ncbi:MAG: hypothetical protein A2Z52_01165 [Candidatus Moranbacteria bacterium RBG_19FT_COMBO_42_6]|nr:MAG: hypothetical protein A2Z52_01165 [Candidatus Moranbacteria bacterium RBG_19FT_COMBO_42_6]
MGTEEENRIALDEARQQAKFDQEVVPPEVNQPKKPMIDMSSDASIIFAVCLAALKDLLDYVGIGSFPLIGTVFTFIFMIAIAMILFLAAPKDFKGNMIMLLGGGGVEAFLFGLNFLPLLTATVLAIYIKMIIKRKSAGRSL